MPDATSVSSEQSALLPQHHARTALVTKPWIECPELTGALWWPACSVDGPEVLATFLTVLRRHWVGGPGDGLRLSACMPQEAAQAQLPPEAASPASPASPSAGPGAGFSWLLSRQNFERGQVSGGPDLPLHCTPFSFRRVVGLCVGHRAASWCKLLQAPASSPCLLV